MKIIVVFATMVLSFSMVCGQESIAKQLLTHEYERECGKPLADGKVYDFREGKIVKVIDGRELLFQQSTLNGDESEASYSIQLAGIDTAGSPSLAKFLTEKLVGREVMVAGNTKTVSDTRFPANVIAPGVGDVNRYLLKNGITKFAEPEYQSVSSYILCVYRETAKEAESQRIGIWKK